MQSFLPYGRHELDEEDVAAVRRALESDTLTGGPEVEAFERELADLCGARHAVACSSGTAALHLICMALSLGEGDRVVVPAITFLASASCVTHVGAEVDFCDIDPESGLATSDTIRAAMTDETRAVMAVDYAGSPLDISRLHSEIGREGLIWIRDASHALGARIQGRPLGAQPPTIAASFSFHPVKAAAAGEGGALVSDSRKLAEACRKLRSHGVVRDEKQFQGGERGPWVYEMQALGLNYRMPDINAALARSQLRKLSARIARRRQIAAFYDRAFLELDHIQPLRTPEDADSARHIYVLLCDFEKLNKSRAEVMHALRARGIGSQVHYIPVFMHPYYIKKYNLTADSFPGAMRFYNRCLTIPLFPSMTDEDMERVVAEVKHAFGM